MEEKKESEEKISLLNIKLEQKQLLLQRGSGQIVICLEYSIDILA